MKIDVVILTFNPDISFLDKSLKNTLSMFRKVHIFDNASDNNKDLKALCSTYTRVNLVNSPKNIGISGINALVEFAFKLGAEAVTISDQDSFLPSHFGNEVISAFRSHENGVFAPIYLDSNKKIDSFSKVWRFGKILCTRSNINLACRSKYIKTEFAIGSGLSIRASDWNKTGGLNPDFLLDCADIEFCLKLRRCNIPIYYIKSMVMKHKIGSKREKILGLYYVSMHEPYRHYLYFKAIVSLVRGPLSPVSFKIHYSIKLVLQYFVYSFLVSNAPEHRKMINRAIRDELLPWNSRPH